MTKSTSRVVPSESSAALTLFVALEVFQPDAFADVDAMGDVFGPHDVGGFGGGDAVQDTVGHFDKRHLQPQLGGDGGGFEPDVSAAHDQDAGVFAEHGRHAVDVGQGADGVETLQRAADGGGQAVGDRAGGEGQLAIAEGFAAKGDGFRRGVDGIDLCAQFQGDGFVFVDRGGAQVEPFFGHVAQKIGLGQGRTFVGRHGFFADQGDGAFKALGAQGFGKGRARLPCPDDQNIAHVDCLWPLSDIGLYLWNLIWQSKDRAMTVKTGDKIPSVTLIHSSGGEVTQVDIAKRVAGRKVVLFGLPGAYTGICTAAHLPSFIRTAEQFREKGVDEIICVSVNDCRVMQHWGETTGAEEAGITLLADWDSELTKALGLEFSVPAIGFRDRMTRCSMLLEDGVVKILQFEEDNGTCNLTAGETLLEMV